MLQCLANKVLRLTDGDILGDKLSDTLSTQNDFLTLIWLFLGHNRLDHFGREFSFLKKLSHTDRLIV